MNLNKNEKQKQNNEENIFFIKTGFRKRVKQPQLLDMIRKHVYSMSQIAHLGSLMFNKFLKYVLETQPELIKDLHFESYSKCQNLMGYVFKILTVGGRNLENDSKVPEALKIVAKEFTDTFQVSKLQRIVNDSQFLKYTYKKYYVNFHNYLWCSFDGKQRRYIRQFLEMNGFNAKEWVSYILFAINNWKKKIHTKPNKKKQKKSINHVTNETNDDKEKKVPDIIQSFIKIQRAWLDNNVEPINEAWLKTHPHIILQYWYHILQDIESNNEKIQTTTNNLGTKRLASMCKTFSLAPMYSIKRHFIDIDNTALKPFTSEFKEHDKHKPRQEDLYHWKQLFDLKGLLTQNQLAKGFRFAGHVQTDGVTLCFMIKKPNNTAKSIDSENNDKNTTKKRKRKNKDEHSNDDYYIDPHTYNALQRVIAIDPGRTNIGYGVEKDLSSGKYKKYKFTRMQFYEESGAKKASAKTAKWILKDGMVEVFTELSLCSLKTTRQENWVQYFKTYVKWRDKLWTHHTKLKYGHLKFKSYILRNRSMDRFLVSLHKGKTNSSNMQKPIIAYGDGSFASTGPGEKAIPNKEFYNKCKRYYKTVLVNEYRTTALCSYCHNRLLNIYHGLKTVSNGEEEVKVEWERFPMRGLKWCNSTNCRFKYVHRDYNSAVNIEQKYHWQANGTPLPVGYITEKENDSRDEVSVGVVNCDHNQNFIRLVSVILSDGGHSMTKRTFGHQ